MHAHRLFPRLFLTAVCLASASPALALANRVFVSARSGNNANSCDNILTPCQTLAGAVVQLNPGGEVIVLDSGGYGPVTITQAVTIEAPAGVTAFIHPPSGDAITINAASADVVVLRGLVLNGGPGNGIQVNSVGSLSVQNCSINGFTQTGISMSTPGHLYLAGTEVSDCGDRGVDVSISGGLAQVRIDHCQFERNFVGYQTASTAPGSATTTATYSSADGNNFGWAGGGNGTGKDVLNLEFCTGSENSTEGVFANSTNAQSVVRYSNCVFSNNGSFGVQIFNSIVVESRGNNTITGNGSAPTSGGTVGSFLPM